MFILIYKQQLNQYTYLFHNGAARRVEVSLCFRRYFDHFDLEKACMHARDFKNETFEYSMNKVDITSIYTLYLLCTLRAS